METGGMLLAPQTRSASFGRYYEGAPRENQVDVYTNTRLQPTSVRL
jgi:hypothetical protein